MEHEPTLRAMVGEEKRNEEERVRWNAVRLAGEEGPCELEVTLAPV